MKLYWTGTDSLMLIDLSRRSFRKKLVWLLFRIIVKVLDKFYVESHYVDHSLLKDRLKKFKVSKPIVVLSDQIQHKNKYTKKAHSKFNLLYYMPHKTSDTSFWKWVYGYDVYLKIKDNLSGMNINWIEVDGSKDMNKIYPIVDFYLRPNRSDGASRMRQECEIQGIPYYWSQTNPNHQEAIKKIKKEYEKKNSSS